MTAKLSEKTVVSTHGRDRPIMPVYVLCAGVILVSILAAIVANILMQRSQQAGMQEYGQALANLSAHRALDSTLNHDLVSLQVILGDAVENPSVLNATIHDVENNLLVQAGQRASTNQGLLNFSAPITLHNSVAGYVTIGLKTGSASPFQQQVYLLFGLVLAILVAMILCYSYFETTNLSRGEHSAIPIVSTPSVAAVAEPEESVIVQESTYIVELMLCPQNYAELSQQLNSKMFRGVNQRLEQILTGVMTLYGGKLIHAEQNALHMQFTSIESQSDAIFNGLCAAWLILQLSEQSGSIQLQLTALVREYSDGRTQLKRLPYSFAEVQEYQQILGQLPSNSLVVESQLLESGDMQKRFETQVLADENNLAKVLGIQQQYKTLLEKQLQQLSQN